MSDPWRGRYVDGQTAAVHDVVLEPAGDLLIGRRLGDDAELFRWPRPALIVATMATGGAVIRTRGTPDASVTTDGAEAARRLGLPAIAAPLPRRLHWAVTFGVGTIAAAGILYASLTPIARGVARHVPPAVEASLGQGLSALMATQYCETKTARASLSRLATRLGAPAATELRILDTETVNAFTFPGGVVVVTRGLLDHAHGPDEVAGVLAHELEHVRLRHVTIRFVRGSLMTVLWQATVGDYSGLFVIDPKTALDVANLRFSRDDERAADRGALERLAAAHVSSQGFEHFFERMRAKTDAVPAWLSSHPASGERIGRIQATASKSSESQSASLSASDWDALKQGCSKK